MKKIIGYPITQLLYAVGCCAGKLRMGGLYNWAMTRSCSVDTWADTGLWREATIEETETDEKHDR